jgi:hypothetical protein
MKYARKILTIVYLCLALPALAPSPRLADAAEDAAVFPAEQRLHVLLIGPPHGYDGRTAAECTLLESLTDLRFSVLPVPYDAGDHIADVDGHFGKDPRWIAIRKAEILRCLQQRYDAVMVTAGVDGDWLWGQALARLVRFATRGTAAPSIIVEAVVHRAVRRRRQALPELPWSGLRQTAGLHGRSRLAHGSLRRRIPR